MSIAWILLFLFGDLILWAIVYIIGSADKSSVPTLSQFLEAGKLWRYRRRQFVDADQSPSVRRWVERLTAGRVTRVLAAQKLGELNDRAAVPALVRAMERYREDVGFLLAAVAALQHLGDARALPMLRSLTSHRPYELMETAREAIAAIEPKAVLLRPGSPPPPSAAELLRPARGMTNADTHYLLRASSPQGLSSQASTIR